MLGDSGAGPSHRYFLRSKSSQSSEVQQQDENQSLQDINTPVPVEEEKEEPSTPECQEHSLKQPAAETRMPGLKPLIKWPNSYERNVWKAVNEDISKFLEQLKGTAEKKLGKMG